MTADLVALEARSVSAGADLETSRSCVEVFRRALSLEAHNLARRPDLLWQQLHNRLAGDAHAGDRLAAERAARSRGDISPWLWARAALSESPLLVHTLLGDEVGWLRACAISPDGSFVVAASEGGTDPGSFARRSSECILMVWEVPSGEPRTSLRGHTRDVRGCAVSPDSSWIASASLDGTIRIWDAATGGERAQLPGHRGTALACAVSPDGSLIASAGQGGVKLWDVAGGRELAFLELANPSGTVKAVAFTAHGVSVLVGLGASPVVWDLSTGELRELGSNGDAHDTAIGACAVSPDDAFAVTSAGREIRIWDLQSGGCRQVVRSPGEWFESCAVSPDGSFVVSAGQDATLRIWDPTSGAELGVLRGHDGWVEACSVSPDGTWILSAGRDGTTRIWEVPTFDGRKIEVAPDKAKAIPECAVSLEAAWVVCGATKPVALAQALSRAGTALSAWGRCALAAGGDVAVSGSWGSFIVWDTATGEELRSIEASSTSAGADACAVAPDGSWMLGASLERLQVWDLRSYASCGMFRAGTDPVTGSSFSHSGAGISDCCIGPDGSWVVSADAGETVKIWESDGGATPAGAPVGMRGHVCAASPDGRWVVCGRRDGSLTIGEFEGELREVRGHDESVIDCAVTPDARLIVSVGQDRALRIWDPVSCAEVAAVFLPSAVDAVAAHPWKPWAACRTALGDVFVEVVGLDYGPPVVTARGPDRLVRCPACATIQALGGEELGTIRPCVNVDCSLELRVNPMLMREGPPEGLFSNQDDEIRREYYDTL